MLINLKILILFLCFSNVLSIQFQGIKEWISNNSIIVIICSCVLIIIIILIIIKFCCCGKKRIRDTVALTNDKEQLIFD